MTAKTTKKTETKTEKSADFGAQGYDAFVKASEVAMKTAETLNGEITAYGKKTLEDMTAAAQELASVKTPAELLEKQTTLAKTAFEGFFAEFNKVTEIYTESAKEITAPFTQQFAAYKPFAA